MKVLFMENVLPASNATVFHWRGNQSLEAKEVAARVRDKRSRAARPVWCWRREMQVCEQTERRKERAGVRKGKTYLSHSLINAMPGGLAVFSKRKKRGGIPLSHLWERV